VRPTGGRWRALRPSAGRTNLQDLAVTPFGDVVVLAAPIEPPFAVSRVWRRPAGSASWERAPDGIGGTDLSVYADLAVGQGGDTVLVYVSGTSNSLVILRADTYEAAPKPLITSLSAPARPVAAGAVQVRIGLSAPGRALVTISPAGRRRVVGAFFATVGNEPRTLGLPARIRSALPRGGYTLTVDTGGTPLAGSRRTIGLRVTGP
jgi:hypothetical protein